MPARLHLVVGLIGMLLSQGCATTPLPWAHSDYSRNSHDRNGEEIVFQDEWLARLALASGLRPGDAVRPPRPLSPAEVKISTLTSRFADMGGNEPMTPLAFHSPPGLRIGRWEF